MAGLKNKTFSLFKNLKPQVTQGSKLLGFRMSRTPTNGEGNPILGPGIVGPTDSLKTEFSDKKP